MQEEAPVKEVWDLKKIILGIIIVVILAGSLYLVKDKIEKNLTSPEKPLGQVEGARVSKVSEARDDVKERLEMIKKEIANLNAMDVASSSPQVKKIIKDLQDLQSYPSTQIKDLCQSMCKSL
ncbi:MAG: hypothetical protein Q7S38_01380 [bacterium]|nr:hypothetical protein [bacterium]